MVKITNPIIKLKGQLDHNSYVDINNLQEICIGHDRTALKLELEYKLRRAEGKSGVLNKINEFMYYDENYLIGYIGLYQFGRSPVEVNGMVHPEYRRRGVFGRLFSLVIDEWRRRESQQLLLLCDSNSTSGQEFIKSVGSHYAHSEYEMFLRSEGKQVLIENDVVLKKATNQDAKEIARQNSVYFEIEYKEENENILMPEEEEKSGTIIYIAEAHDKIIGKIHLEIREGIGGIYGFGVLPEYRRQGYGRKILTRAIHRLQSENVKDIMLQVEIKNSKALNLYTDCGFEVTSRMDYFEINNYEHYTYK